MSLLLQKHLIRRNGSILLKTQQQSYRRTVVLLPSSYPSSIIISSSSSSSSSRNPSNSLGTKNHGLLEQQEQLVQQQRRRRVRSFVTTTTTYPTIHSSNSSMRKKSTTAAAVTTADDDDDDDDEAIDNDVVVVTHQKNTTSTNNTTTTSSSGNRRTRLQELRKKLQTEKQEKRTHLKQVHELLEKEHQKEQQEQEGIPLLVDNNDNDNDNASLSSSPTPFENILIDKYGRKHTYLRISVAERCNLRCTYCMPLEGVPLQKQTKLLSTEEILYLSKLFIQSGITKVRLTGGEPTLRKDLDTIIEGIHQLGMDNHNHNRLKQIGMTTNGVTLSKQLQRFLQLGLNSVNISLDTLQPEKFEQLTRRPKQTFYKVYETLELANELVAASGKFPNVKIKINVVVMRNVNDNEIVDFINLQKQLFPNISIRFIEYMPFTENGWNRQKFISYQEIINAINTDTSHDLQLQPLPVEDPHDTTKWFSYDNSQQKKNIGFITSMSNHFCAGCNRLRLTADGQIKVCLFDGNSTLSLRDTLRQSLSSLQQQQSSLSSSSISLSSLPPHDDQWVQNNLNELVYTAIQQKKYALGGHKTPEDISNSSDGNRPMTLIGG